MQMRFNREKKCMKILKNLWEAQNLPQRNYHISFQIRRFLTWSYIRLWKFIELGCKWVVIFFWLNLGQTHFFFNPWPVVSSKESSSTAHLQPNQHLPGKLRWPAVLSHAEALTPISNIYVQWALPSKHISSYFYLHLAFLMLLCWARQINYKTSFHHCTDLFRYFRSALHYASSQAPFLFASRELSSRSMDWSKCSAMPHGKCSKNMLKPKKKSQFNTTRNNHKATIIWNSCPKSWQIA